VEDILDKMNPNKRKALINAALLEFGNNSYEKASTNVIVKSAGISKGLLYHYFKNKEELYNYLETFLYENYVVDVIDHIDFNKSDILERITQTVEYKMSTFEEYPGILAFSKSFYAGKNIEDLKAKVETYVPGYYQRFFSENVDYSLFRSDIDFKKALQMAQWILEKFSDQYVMKWEMTGVYDSKEMYEELKGYLLMLRKLFYKQDKDWGKLVKGGAI